MVFPRLPLLWRVFAINAGLLVLGTLALVVFPRRVHVSTGVFESFDVIAGVVLVLAANFLLLRPVLSPVDRLVERMRTVDLLRPGQRLPEAGGPEVVPEALRIVAVMPNLRRASAATRVETKESRSQPTRATLVPPESSSRTVA